MGIKNLKKAIKRYTRNGFEPITLENIYGSTLAIDASVFMYKYGYMPRFEPVIMGFYGLLNYLIRNGVIPLLVFDGEPPEEKAEVIEKRKTGRKTLKNKIESLEKKIQTTTDLDRIIKLNTKLKHFKRRLIMITPETIQNLKILAKSMGVSYVVSKVEADILCTTLVVKGYADYVATEDLDLMVFGCPRIITGLGINDRPMELYKKDIILKELKLSDDQFTDFCILLGCDYSSTIRGIGMVNAYKYIRIHKSIERIIKKLHIDLTENNRFNYQSARNIFCGNYTCRKPTENERNAKKLYLFFKKGIKHSNYKYQFQLYKDSLIMRKKLIKEIEEETDSD